MAVPRSHVTGCSRSEHSSVVGSNTTPKMPGFVAKPIDKRPGDVSDDVLEALKGGGHHSACLRGGALSSRYCQTCKDVARECPLGFNCLFLSERIEARLLKLFAKETDEATMAGEVVRFVKELASGENDTRALQVVNMNLMKPTANAKETESNVVLMYVRNHTKILKKLAFCQQKLMESKKEMQVEAEIPVFLKEIGAECDKADVAKLLTEWRLLEAFQPFLAKEREKAAEAEAAGKKKATMHADSDIVDNFFKSHKPKGIDRAFMKAMLLMSLDKA